MGDLVRFLKFKWRFYCFFEIIFNKTITCLAIFMILIIYRLHFEEIAICREIMCKISVTIY